MDPTGQIKGGGSGLLDPRPAMPLVFHLQRVAQEQGPPKYAADHNKEVALHLTTTRFRLECQASQTVTQRMREMTWRQNANIQLQIKHQ